MFPCFCSQRRLKMLKENAHGSSTLGGYDNRCLFLDKKESLRRMESGQPYVLRLKPPKEDIVVHDKIKGDVVFKASQVDAQVFSDDPRVNNIGLIKERWISNISSSQCSG